MEVARMLWELLINPNVTYVLLIAGLWFVVLAWIVPGTGVAESIAVVLLALALIGLVRLPINGAGLLLIALAMGLFVAEFHVQSHGAMALGGAAALAVGSLLLFRPEPEAVRLSRWLVAATTLSTLAFALFALSMGVKAQKLAVRTGMEHLIGARGYAATDLKPEGAVQVSSELWTAVADEPIKAGQEVVVVGLEGLRLRVARDGLQGNGNQ